MELSMKFILIIYHKFPGFEIYSVLVIKWARFKFHLSIGIRFNLVSCLKMVRQTLKIFKVCLTILGHYKLKG